MLKCKISDVAMARTINGLLLIHNLDCQVVVLIDESRLRLSVTQFMKHKSKTLCDFSCSISCNELRFSGTLCTDGLCARLTCHSPPARHHP